MHKFLFTLLIFCSFSALKISSQSTYTDGMEYHKYVDDELFKIFKAKYWNKERTEKRISYKEALKENILFVRLENNDKEIAALKERGRTSVAKKLQVYQDNKNEQMISGMNDFYDLGEYYFYYPDDAKAIFVNHDYSKLLNPDLTPVESFDIKDIGFAILFNHLYIWDVNRSKMMKLKKRYYLPIFRRRYNLDHYENIKNFFNYMK